MEGKTWKANLNHIYMSNPIWPIIHALNECDDWVKVFTPCKLNYKIKNTYFHVYQGN